MQVSEHHGDIRLDFNYNPAIISPIKTIPGWRYHKTPLGSFWTVPYSSLNQIQEIGLISPGHLYPHITKRINPHIFNNLSVKVKSFGVMAAGSRQQLDLFITSLYDLCSYEEKIEKEFEVKSLARTIYHKNNIVVMEFPEGLYYRVSEFLSLFVFRDYEVKPYHIKPIPSLNLNLENLTPRSYQEQASEEVVNGNIQNRATLVMATGAGKTILSALITAKLSVPTIFYTYSKDLLEQTAVVYEELFQQEIGRVGGNRFTIKPITIASIQTVYSCWEKQDHRWNKLSSYLNDVQCMFIDEGHMLGAETIFKVAEITNSYYSYALTATPFREDGKEIFIEAGTGPAVELVSEQELVEEGYVLPVEVEVYPVQHFMSRKKRYHNLYEAEIIDHWERNRKIIRAVRSHQGKQIIILVKEIEHGKKLMEVLDVPFIHGSTSAKERKAVLDSFKNRELDIIIASSILKQGIDLPEAEVLVLAHGGTSLVELMQKVGRVRRPASGKEKGIVIDFYDYIKPKMDDDIFRAQSERRLAFYKSKGFTIIKKGDNSSALPNNAGVSANLKCPKADGIA